VLYYIHKNLQYGNGFIGKGCVHPLDGLKHKNLQILIAKRAISTFNVPPMDQLPGWQLRYKRFQEHDIDVHRFFGMSDDEIAEVIGSRPHVIAKWRAELRELLGLNRAKIKSG
jgi:hypothetical protein